MSGWVPSLQRLWTVPGCLTVDHRLSSFIQGNRQGGGLQKPDFGSHSSSWRSQSLIFPIGTTVALLPIFSHFPVPAIQESYRWSWEGQGPASQSCGREGRPGSRDCLPQ